MRREYNNVGPRLSENQIVERSGEKHNTGFTGEVVLLFLIAALVVVAIVTVFFIR
jgi:hypothetical protein